MNRPCGIKPYAYDNTYGKKYDYQLQKRQFHSKAPKHFEKVYHSYILYNRNRQCGDIIWADLKKYISGNGTYALLDFDLVLAYAI
jgi:hypothetical protein